MALVSAEGFEWYTYHAFYINDGNEFNAMSGWTQQNMDYMSASDSGTRYSRTQTFAVGNYSAAIYRTVPSRSEYFVQFALNAYVNDVNNLLNSGKLIGFYANSSASYPQVIFKLQPYSMALEWGTSDYNRVGWVSDDLLANTGTIHLLFRVKCHSTTGFIEVYANGKLFGSAYNVNTNPQATGEISFIKIFTPYYNNLYFDDLIVWNADQDGSRFFEVLPAMFIRGCYLIEKQPDALDTTIALLAKMDGSNNATTIPTYGSKITQLYTVGTTKNSSTQYKWNSTSLYFDGSSLCYIPESSQFLLGTGTFTVECWIYWTVLPSAPNPQTVFCFESSADGIDKELYLFSDSTTTFKLKYGIRGGSYTTRSFTVTTLTDITWHHIAVTRDSNGVIRFFLNGVASAETYTDATAFNGALQFVLGGEFDYNSNLPQYGVKGYIDDFRLTAGVARYTSGFTVPSAAFDSTDANWSKVLLLLNGYGTDQSTIIVDSSDRNIPFLVYGQAKLSTLQYTLGSASCVFDGNGSYLKTQCNTAPLELSNNDFTIELHFLATAYGKNNGGSYYSTLISKMGANGNAWSLRLYGQTSFTSIQFHITSNGTDYTILTVNSPIIPLGLWKHICVVRSGTTLLLGLNGVIVGSTTFSGSVNTSLNTPVMLGAENADSLSGDFTGYIDETRILTTVSAYSGTVGSLYTIPGNFPYPVCGVTPSTIGYLDKNWLDDGTSLYLGYPNRSSFFSIRSSNNLTFQQEAEIVPFIFPACILTVRTNPSHNAPYNNQYHIKTNGALKTFTTPTLHTEWRTFRSFTCFDGNGQEFTAASLDNTVIGLGRT